MVERKDSTQGELFGGEETPQAKRTWKLTVEQKEEIAKAYAAGGTAGKLSAQWDITKTNVLRIVRKFGVEVRKAGRPTDAATDEQRAEIARAYESGETSTALSRRYGYDRGTILSFVRQMGGKVRDRREGVPDGHKRCTACKGIFPQDAFKSATLRKTGQRVTRGRCRECLKLYIQKFAAEHRGEYTRKIRLEMIAAYGGACYCCGITSWEFLTIDHIAGGGHQERKRLKMKGVQFYLWLRRQDWPKEGYRLACYNCNLAAGFYGACPHVAGGEEKPEEQLEASSQSDRKRIAQRLYMRRLRRDVIVGYGGACACCGVSEAKFLAIDHVEGGGCQERAKKAYKTYLIALKRQNFPPTHRLLCHNCNCSRGITGYCPCGREKEVAAQPI